MLPLALFGYYFLCTANFAAGVTKSVSAVPMPSLSANSLGSITWGRAPSRNMTMSSGGRRLALPEKKWGGLSQRVWKEGGSVMFTYEQCCGQ